MPESTPWTRPRTRSFDQRQREALLTLKSVAEGERDYAEERTTPHLEMRRQMKHRFAKKE